jgi:prolyl-tRNA editing enzyme YbaK/EbsC (Cys-tRNA(Pro) deacylase)
MHTVLPSLRSFLADAGVTYTELHHEPTLTSEASARARGEELRNGGKAIVLKVDEAFALFVLPADRKLDSLAIRTALHAKKMRFASPEELLSLTGLVPGSVPPFGQPILPLPLYADEALTQNDRIAFNAGSLTDSMTLSMSDYLRVAKPTVLSFSLAAA